MTTERPSLAKTKTANLTKKEYWHTKIGCRTCKFVTIDPAPCESFLSNHLNYDPGNRLRKIRCDEAWPICQNCAKTNRNCQRGSRASRHKARWTFRTPLTASYFQPSCSTAGLDDNDIAYLDAFRYRFIGGIVGTTTRSAWRRLILQAVHQVSAFRHAAIAFSAAYGLAERPGNAKTARQMMSLLPVASKSLALRHYSKCMQDLQRLITRSEEQSINSTLLCSMICICFELRINKPDNALRHLEHSLSIMASNPTIGIRPPSPSRSVAAKANVLRLVDDDIALAFCKLDIQAAAFIGHRAPKANMNYLTNVTLGQPNRCVETDKTLSCLVGKIFTFIRTKADRHRFNCVEPPAPSVYGEVEVLKDELNQFRREHLAVGAQGTASITKLPPPYQVCCMTYLMMSILLSSCLSTDEGVFDAFFSDFTTIITLAENIVNDCDAGCGDYKEFRLDMAILYPVYKTAQMCRCPLVRRRALKLFQGVTFDEGVWDAQSGKRYIEILMRLEEEDLKLQQADLERGGPWLIPEQQRIRALDIQPEDGEQYGTIFFRYNSANGQWDVPVEAVFW